MVPSYPEAASYAALAHGKQVRKYSGLPYVTHPLSVASRVHALTQDPAVLCAAVLHDVVEDTTTTIETINMLFGEKVGQLVDELTSRKGKGNRAERKAKEAERLSKISPFAMLIKTADIFDNCQGLVVDDKEFAKVYFAEKVVVLKQFVTALSWDHPEFAEYADSLLTSLIRQLPS